MVVRRPRAVRARQESTRAGTFIRSRAGGEEYFPFHPRALPPDPRLEVGADLQRLLDEANQGLYSFVRKEAVLSSQIEGTQSSLSDLVLFEHDVVPGVPVSDVRETSNYIRAMNHGFARIEGGFPLSLRLIREIHEL